MGQLQEIREKNLMNKQRKADHFKKLWRIIIIRAESPI